MRTVLLPRRTFDRLLDPNPLIRTSDRVEALVLLCVVVVALLAVPVAAAAGVAVHDERSRHHAEQARQHRTVTATVTGTGDPRRNIERPTATVPASWSVAGTTHSGDVVAHRTVKAGQQIEIWVDDRGSPVAKPTRTALDEAVTFAIGVWCGVSASAVALYVTLRIVLDRFRYAGWQRDIDRLVRRP